jgi:DNA-binding CsgD family transcriptional regulator
MDAIVPFGLALRAEAEPSGFTKASVRFFESRGIRMMSYHHLPPLGAFDRDLVVPVVQHGYPEDWVERYRKEELNRIDPIPRKALQAVRPFRWSDVYKASDLKPEERRYLDMAREADLGEGFAVPVFGPFGRNGYLGLGVGPGRKAEDGGEMLTLQIAAQLAHQRYCEFLFENRPKEIALSQREKQILCWVARGKSNAVIADILDLSTNTVDTYTRRLFAKLEVNDRITAALRGLALGVID